MRDGGGKEEAAELARLVGGAASLRRRAGVVWSGLPRAATREEGEKGRRVGKGKN